ncbi:MAG: C69 family dipeptidase [Anaerolineae bacterium]
MSYCIYIGRNLTDTGQAYLAGYGDEPSSHWLELAPRQQHPSGTTIEVGVTPLAEVPGVRSNIPQVAETARNLRVSYSYYMGVPAPITNGGLNEHGVAVRDVWSTSHERLQAVTPADQTGPNYSDLARIVLERATSARHGVEIIGELIAEYGYSTYGGNSHFIGDENEGWVVIEFAGGQKLWAAERVGPDEIRVNRPGYIGEIPADFMTNPNFMGPPHLIQFAIDQNWYDPASGPFNVNHIYGDGKYRWDGVQWIEDEMRARANRPEKISLADAMWAIRTEKLTGDTAGYGQVVPLGPVTDNSLRMLWHAPIGAMGAPFTPFYLGVDTVPPEFGLHRYLTTGEDWKFMDDRKVDKKSTVAQRVEATKSAVYIFKRLLYLLAEHHETFMPEVTPIWEAFEQACAIEQKEVVETAETLLAAGKPYLAQKYLTDTCSTQAQRSLDLGEAMVNSMEARSRILFGIREEKSWRGPEQLW